MATTQASSSSAQVDVLPTTEGLYARKSSGLVRELGMRDAFGVNIAAVSPSFAPIVFLVALALFPGADMTIPVLIAAAMGVLLVLSYSQLIASMPRSGGDYIYASRVFTPILGAAIGGAAFIAFLLGGSGPGILWGSQFLPFLLQAAGSALHWHQLTSWSTELAASKDAAFIASCGLLALVLVVMLTHTRRVTQFIFWGFIVSAIGMLVLIVLLLTHSNTAFQAHYNAFGQMAGSYRKVISAYAASGHHLGVSTTAVINTIPFAVTAIAGFTVAVYPGGEVKRPSTTFRYGSLTALGASAALLLIVWLAMRHTVGLHFMQSAGWLSQNDPTSYAKASSLPAFAPLYGLVLSGDPVTKLLLGLGFAAGEFAIVAAGILIISRLLFGMSFDRLLPSRVTYVSPRSHAPVTAVLIAVAGTIGFIALGNYTNYLVNGRNTVLVSAGIYGLGSLAAAILPYRRRDLFRSSPQILGTVRGIPTITIIGGISALFNGYVLYLVAVKPQLSGGYDTGSVITLIAVVTIGAVAYIISRTFLRSRGIDMTLASRELPPD